MVKDRIVSWFFRNYILPKAQILDKPGFVAFNISYKSKIYIRQVILPEYLFVNLENKIINSDKKHENFLYNLGKEFGYRFSTMTKLPTIKDVNGKDFLQFAKLMVKFVEGTYSGGIEYDINMKNKEIILHMKDFVICRNSGIGHILSSGGIAGVWAYALQDTSVEAVHTKCQGRGDKFCETISAPVHVLKKQGYEPFEHKISENLEIEREYPYLNRIRNTRWSRNSMINLINGGFFRYSKGKITFGEERFFLAEASFIYILEKKMKKIKNGMKLLWDTSFEWGFNFAKRVKKQPPAKFIMDLFPALGFGDIYVKENPWKIMINYFPWTKWEKDVDFILLKGLFSGIISGFTGKHVVLNNLRKSLYFDGLSIIIEE